MRNELDNFWVEPDDVGVSEGFGVGFWYDLVVTGDYSGGGRREGFVEGLGFVVIEVGHERNFVFYRYVVEDGLGVMGSVVRRNLIRLIITIK